MKILVTGANGFLGRACVAEFLKANKEVVSLIGSKGEKDEANQIQADIRDKENLKKVTGRIGKVDAIVHCAGLAHQFGKINEKEFYEINSKGAENVAELARETGANRFVLISSVAVYGKGLNDTSFVDENFQCKPQGVYAKSKFEGEQRTRELCEKNSIFLTILRPTTIIGEGDRGNVARLINLIDKKRFFWIGRGENLKSLIYKKDAARACLMVLENKFSQTEIFNLVGETIPMRLIVEKIAAELERSIPRFHFPIRYFEDHLPKISQSIPKMSVLTENIIKWRSSEYFSGKKLSKLCGFYPETTILEGLRRQIADYKETKK